MHCTERIFKFIFIRRVIDSLIQQLFLFSSRIVGVARIFGIWFEGRFWNQHSPLFSNPIPHNQKRTFISRFKPFTPSLLLLYCFHLSVVILLPVWLSGCSTILESIDELKPVDIQRFKVEPGTLHRAAVHYLLNEGYSILASDLSGGILSAEKSSPELLAEEQAESGRFAPTVAEAILGILGIILAIGFLFLVIKAVLEQQNQVGERSNYMMDNRVTGGTMAQEETLFYYRYIISLSYEPIETGLTELKLSIVRERFEKGIVVKSDKLQGKKLYSTFFQGISKQLPHLR